MYRRSVILGGATGITLAFSAQPAQAFFPLLLRLLVGTGVKQAIKSRRKKRIKVKKLIFNGKRRAKRLISRQNRLEFNWAHPTKIRPTVFVTDKAGSPLQDVEIIITSGGTIQKESTNSSGYTEFSIRAESNRITITLKKQGFTTKIEDIDLNSSIKKTKKYILEKESKIAAACQYIDKKRDESTSLIGKIARKVHKTACPPRSS